MLTTRATLLCLPLMLAFAGPSLADKNPLQDAALNAAVAAQCRAQTGDDELFDAAFEALRQVASEAAKGPSDDELESYRQKLLTETPEANGMTPETCAALRAFIIPK